MWSIARGLTRRRSKKVCAHCGVPSERIEVNHIKPVRGSGYSLSCFHHLDNLEALCHPCHVVVTRKQAAEARAQAAS